MHRKVFWNKVTLKMEAVRSAETVVKFYQSKWYHVEENGIVSVLSASIQKQLNRMYQRAIQNASVGIRGVKFHSFFLCVEVFCKLDHEVTIPQIFYICT